MNLSLTGREPIMGAGRRLELASHLAGPALFGSNVSLFHLRYYTGRVARVKLGNAFLFIRG